MSIFIKTIQIYAPVTQIVTKKHYYYYYKNKDTDNNVSIVRNQNERKN